MSDIALDAQGDIALSGGLFGLVYDAEWRAQRIRIALKHRMGEWFRDQLAGTDYDGAIIGKSTELSRRAEVRRRVLELPGIASVTSITTELDRASRHWSCVVECLQDDGAELEVAFAGRA